MKANDRQLQEMFVRATDDIIPPAPWLEAQVIDAVHQSGRARRRAFDLGALGAFGPSLRLTAALMALLIIIGTVAALLMTTRLHMPTVPGGRSTTVQTPAPSPPHTFTPSPAVRASNWPPGGPVPAQLAGSWQPDSQRAVLHLGAYTWELGDETGEGCGPGHGPCYTGNVVVNGSEIDFIDDACTARAAYGFERFTYTLTGNILVLTRMQGSGQSSCIWLLAGTYSRVS